jgi:hypothetical protein
MSRLFISHSSKDQKFAERLAEDLLALGHEPWLDAWRIKVGECIPSKIEHAVSEADYVVIVLSPDSVKSGWVDREWKSKYWDEIQETRTLVLPVLLRDCRIPQLLKTKKYADFTENYSRGIVELTGAIMPVVVRAEEGEEIPVPSYQSEVAELIALLQAGKVRVSEVVAKALLVAQRARSDPLEWFCRNELAGWTQQEWDRYPGGEPTYRLVEAFATVSARVNLQYWGWGRSAAAVFQYMREHPDDFWPLNMMIVEPVSSVESRASQASISAVISLTRTLGEFLPDTEKPDVPVAIYVSPDSYIRVLESVRTELTRRLLALLPRVTAEPP